MGITMKMWKALAAAGLLVPGTMLGTASEPAAAVADSTPTHCNVYLTPVPDGQPATSAPAPEEECFSSFAESIRAATGGGVVLPADAKTVTAAQLSGADPAGASSVVLGTEYQDSNFGGSSWNITSSVGCGSGYFVSLNLSGAWNDSIGSARTYSNCKSGHFEHPNNTGSVRICGCATMGVLDDETSSLRFSLSGL